MLGKMLYLTYCISCHNANPHLPGPIGPELYNTSWIVVEQKLKYGSYPNGYKAKRNTHIMPTFPQLIDKSYFIYKYLKEYK